MVCFKAWIKPDVSLDETSRIIGEVLMIDLNNHKTTRFDEYPGYEIDFDDLYGNLTDSYDAHVSLIGVPENLESLIAKFPDEYGIKDENYAIKICAHNGLPLKVGNIFALEYLSSTEMADDLIGKMKKAGIHFDFRCPPLVIESDGNATTIPM
ncbi:MAG: hypothetical protein RL748_1742 [Pseudomonadota bacterium]|jgi:hypothetical protein